MSRRIALASVSAVAISSLFAGAAFAQAAGSEAEAAQLGEVVVTAQRVQSNVQTTPISVAVVSAEQVATRGVTNVTALTNVEPTLQVQGPPQAATFSIRGVTSTGSTQYGGSAVAIAVDDQYVLAGQQGSTFMLPLYDLNRIEVLKGPQGTLFGVNTTAGQVNVLTNPPVLKRFQAGVNAEAGNYDAARLDAYANVPLGETVAVRLGVFRSRREGYREHPASATTPAWPATDNENIWGARASALWEPTSRLSARLTYEYLRTKPISNSSAQTIIAPLSSGTPGTVPTNVGPPEGINKRSWPVAYEGVANIHSNNIRGKLTYDFDFATLELISSYYKTGGEICTSALSAPAGSIICYQGPAGNAWTALGNAGGYPHTPAGGYNGTFDRSYQEEVRISGETGFGLKWQGGLFYNDFTRNQNYFIFVTGVTGRFDPTYLRIPFVVGPQVNHQVNKAVYGQFTQKLTEQLSVTGGVRYTEIKQDTTESYNDSLNVGPFLGSGGTNISYTHLVLGGVTKDHNTSYRIGVDYQPTPRNLIYASMSTGFNQGGITQYNPYEAEEVKAYEIGSKNRFLDNRLQLNAAAWLYDFTNQQYQGPTVLATQPGQPPTTVLTTLNGAASRSKGVEAQAIFLLTSNDRISVSATYLRSRYLDFVVQATVWPGTPVTTVPLDVSGQRTPVSPTWNGTVEWEHTFRLGSADLVFNAASRMTAGYYLGAPNLAGNWVDAYTRTDLTLTYRPRDSFWEAGVWVRNLEDQEALVQAGFGVSGGLPQFSYAWSAPRTVGVRFSAKY